MAAGIPLRELGLNSMDRRNELHRSARVDLPTNVQYPPEENTSFISPMLGFLIGIIGFVTSGGAIILTAALVALRIQ